MRKTPYSLFLLASAEGPLSAADAAKLHEEACTLMFRWNHSGIGYRRQLVADIRDLIRPLDASDPKVAELHTWLATNDPDWSPPVPEVAPAPPPPPVPSVEIVLAPVTPAEVEAARGELEAAQRTASERDAAHGHNIEARDAAKTKAAETNDDDDWTRYHAADRAVIQSEALCKRAASELARLQEAFGETVTAECTTRFDAALEACADQAFAAMLADGVPLRVQSLMFEKAAEQVVFRATIEQNRKTSEAFAVGRELGLTEDQIRRRMVRGELAGEGAPQRSVRAAYALLGRLAFAQVAAAEATPERMAAE